MLNSADITAGVMKTESDLKAFNSAIPNILDFIRIAQFSPKVQSNKYSKLSFFCKLFSRLSTIQNRRKES